MSRFTDAFGGLGLTSREDDEGLFSRDVNGQLVRLDAPTEEDYGKQVTLQIDAQPVTVPLAEPLKDAQGNVVLDLDGRTTPRYTTIYDAALRLYVKQPGDEAKIPIPTLCHQPHMNPVAVCRLCVVQIYGMKRGKRSAERKLLPACQHQVKEGMEVFTMNARNPDGMQSPDGQRVRQAVAVMTELLAADHLKPAPPPAPSVELAPFNELGQMAHRCGVSETSRFKLDVLQSGCHGHVPMPVPAIDSSSPVFLVDHSACILCDRCSRACDDVKHNNVIGRVGKGPTAAIGFDLADPMGESSCVQCGECMVSCPTSAITFKPVAKVKPRVGSEHQAQVLPAAELLKDPLFAGVPPKFLLWQEGLALRRTVKAGDPLCRQGEPGNTAFLIRSGDYEITAWDAAAIAKRDTRPGLLGLFTRSRGVAAEPRFRGKRTPSDVVLGEMACLSGAPRTADITALTDGEVWEVRRNVLDRMIRSPAQRGLFETIYRERVMRAALEQSDLFRGMERQKYDACVEFLRPRLSFVSVTPGQVIFRQGDWADNVYLVRLGHVRVEVRGQDNREITTIFRGPGTAIGEIGLLAIAPEDARKSADEVDAALEKTLRDCPTAELTANLPAGRRTATCSALDHLELVRLRRADFLEMVQRYPAVRRRLVELALKRLRSEGDVTGPLMREYIEQGLYQAQSLLVLDLNSCTRCDECTKACVDQHGTQSHGLPITRLLRDGLRFDDYLVATSCRSCEDAYCMIGCPVDSIHRGRHKQIVIEDHCIGCGLCATNCPYGNIWMVPNEHRRIEVDDRQHAGQKRLVAQPKAATCDLCDAEGQMAEPKPRCVHACPHDAAHRMTGADLLASIARGSGK
jgi:CRP-like cAMP-binding protein/Fe-S-cluster-containing hydrogenase component 2